MFEASFFALSLPSFSARFNLVTLAFCSSDVSPGTVCRPISAMVATGACVSIVVDLCVSLMMLPYFING